jgi:subtilisin family serine protease
MKPRWLVWLMLVVFVSSAAATPALAANGDKIVRTSSSDGLGVINAACQLLGCTVLGSLDILPGSTGPSSLFLVRGLVQDVVTFLLSLLGLASIEPDLPVALQQTASLGQASVAILDQKRTPMTYYGTVAWEAYFVQPAADIVGVRYTHCNLRATGGGTVAVIDSGVDPNHPTLKPVLTAGYDFTRNVAGGSEMADLAQASVALLDQVQLYQVNQASVALLDQASVALLDSTPAYSDFGHGTMVAGIVHLVAPTAKIMPLKAFAANGQGYTSDILRAVYYATLKGAKVINMSFSRPTSSPELKRAINYATSKGLITVAAAGNNDSSVLVYPAAMQYVMGVASTTDYDTRSSFSNYGAQQVWVAAPGEGIITTYPWGSYAAGWGTSFSAPLVSGAAALVVGMKGSANYSQASWAIAHAKVLSSDLGHGRLALPWAVTAARSLWYSTNYSPVPTTCSQGVDWSAAH